MYMVVKPIFSSGGDTADVAVVVNPSFSAGGGGSDSLGESQMEDTPANRTTLWGVLESIAAGTAPAAMEPPSNGSGALGVSLGDLAQVVTRHAAVMRNRLHGEEVMGPLGLSPYVFPHQ